ASLQKKLNEKPGLEQAKLILHQSGSLEADMLAQFNSELKTGIIEDIFQKNERSLLEKTAEAQQLRAQLQQAYLVAPNDQTLLKEIQLQYPQIERIAMVGLAETRLTAQSTDTVPSVLVHAPKLPDNQLEKFRKWLQLRLNQDSLRLMRYD